MTVEFDREHPLQEGGAVRYYKVGGWGWTMKRIWPEGEK